MNVHRLTAAPGAELTSALARFEEQFTYPLGPGRSFRISHGDDYPRFFRAIGEAACFVAERDGVVLGVLGLAATRVRAADGSERPSIYLGDLKIAPAARGGVALVRLAEAGSEWCRDRAGSGFGVVMDGTRVTPDRYTGRLGIPAFREVAKIAVLRLPARPMAGASWESTAANGAECFARLSAGRVSTGGGHPLERSETAPVWIVAPDGSACGRLEDTRRAKRLTALGPRDLSPAEPGFTVAPRVPRDLSPAEPGFTVAPNDSEMVAAHLSCIGYANHDALAELIRRASGIAAARGFPAVFAAVPASEVDALLAILAEPGVVVAPATVFASGFEPGERWSINTAEI